MDENFAAGFLKEAGVGGVAGKGVALIGKGLSALNPANALRGAKRGLRNMGHGLREMGAEFKSEAGMKLSPVDHLHIEALQKRKARQESQQMAAALHRGESQAAPIATPAAPIAEDLKTLQDGAERELKNGKSGDRNLSAWGVTAGIAGVGGTTGAVAGSLTRRKQDEVRNEPVIY